MQYDTIIDDLLAEFPELIDEYNENEEMSGLPYLVFGIIFSNYLIRLFENGDEKERLLHAFDFIERMFISGDDELDNLAAISVTESLMYEREFTIDMRPFFGEKTRETIEMQEKLSGLDQI